MRTTLLVLIATLAGAGAVWAEQGAPLTVADSLELQQLYARYNMAVDSANAKMLETVFVPDGEFVSGGRTIKGRGLVPATATVKERPQVRHMASSITFTASPEGARGTSYLMLVNLQAMPPAIMGGGYYEDVIVKTPDGWRFKTRNYYSQATPPAAPAQGAAPAPQGSSR
jgi:hypothetical protein